MVKNSGLRAAAPAAEFLTALAELADPAASANHFFGRINDINRGCTNVGPSLYRITGGTVVTDADLAIDWLYLGAGF